MPLRFFPGPLISTLIPTLLLILLLGPIAPGCGGDRGQLAGRYSAETGDPGSPVTVLLELGPDGRGFWSLDTDNAPFRWDLHQGTLRLHTPSGGVIEGVLADGGIRVTLPGTGTIRFLPER
jgi:hypothetical protein